jgi:hypothetical protein
MQFGHPTLLRAPGLSGHRANALDKWFHELRKEALQMVYVGMDVHRKRTQVGVIDERGEEISDRNFPNDPGERAPMLMTLEHCLPVLAGIKVVLSVERSTLTPAAAGSFGSYQKENGSGLAG